MQHICSLLPDWFLSPSDLLDSKGNKTQMFLEKSWLPFLGFVLPFMDIPFFHI
jgi:hypothetical protein